MIGRTNPLSLTPIPKAVLTKPYDWTYTATSLGHFDPDHASNILSHSSWKPADPGSSSNAIFLDELSRQDPILFYAEVPLSEDELHDNRASSTRPSRNNCDYLFLFSVLFHKLIDD